MNKTNDNEPILGFFSGSNEFLIGEYFPKVGCTAEFALDKTCFGFRAQIYDDAFKLVLNPNLKSLWNMTKNINTMRDMESYLISIGLIKLD